jgi:hypothetical protein
MVSPVVGIYAIMGVQTAVTGGGWFPALAPALCCNSWWQLWAVPLVLGSILGFATLHVLIDKVRGTALPKCSS